MFKILEVLLISSRHSMILVLEEGLSSLLTYFVSSKAAAVLFISPQPHYSYQLAIQLALPLAYVLIFKSLFTFLSPVFFLGIVFLTYYDQNVAQSLLASQLLNSVIIHIAITICTSTACAYTHHGQLYSQSQLVNMNNTFQLACFHILVSLFYSQLDAGFQKCTLVVNSLISIYLIITLLHERTSLCIPISLSIARYCANKLCT